MNARVALIDPHEAVRIGLTYVLQPLGISVRASLASTCEFHQSQPDVDIVILDVPEKERSEVRHLTAEIRKSVPMVIIHHSEKSVPSLANVRLTPVLCLEGNRNPSAGEGRVACPAQLR
jgi:DNA-binding NarL/FixJ family response regulator